jgi:HK97 family phage major capsid protein
LPAAWLNTAPQCSDQIESIAMLTHREILVRRDQLRTELGAILEAHGTAELPAEVRVRADELEAEATRLNDVERRVVVVDELARHATGKPLDGSAGSAGRLEVRAFEGVSSPAPEAFDGQIIRTQAGDRVPILEHRHRLAAFLPPSESRAAELGIGGFLRALHNGPQSDLERRVLGEASIGAGGAFVPVPLAAEIIDLLRARAVAFQAGARTIPMTAQSLRFARVTADPAGSWRAESAAIAVADPTFDNVTLTAKSWALVVKISRELLEDAVNLDEQLRSTFARVAALALDLAVLNGSGASNQPLGIAGTSGIQTVSMATNGASFATYGGANGPYAAMLDAALALDNANAGTLSAMIMAPRSSRAISGFLDSLGNPMRPPPRFATVPQLVTTSMGVTETQGSSSTASSILLGDFSNVFVGMRTALQVSVLSERFADVGQIGFVLWMRGDVQVARPAALARIQGIIP